MALDPVAARLLADAGRSGAPNAHLLPIDEARRKIAAFYAPFTGPDMASVENLLIPVGGTSIRGRAYLPSFETELPVLVYFHGGGWLLGDIDDYDVVARKLAAATGCVVVSVDYRLGPEHRFPAAVNDAFQSVRWVASHAGALGADGSKIVLVGDSAGGNLATVTAARCRDEHGPPIRHQVLVYPVTTCDLDLGFDMQYDGVVLERDELLWHQHNYLSRQDQRRNPLVSPLLADLAGLPAATIVLAQCDPIAVQGRRYADALAAAGVEVTVREYPGMIHGFLGLDDLFGQAAEAMAFVAEAIGRSS